MPSLPERIRAYETQVARAAVVTHNPQVQEKLDALNIKLRRTALPPFPVGSEAATGSAEAIVLIHKSGIEKMLDEMKPERPGLDWLLVVTASFEVGNGPNGSSRMQASAKLNKLAEWESAKFFKELGILAELGFLPDPTEVQLKNATFNFAYVVTWPADWHNERGDYWGKERGFQVVINNHEVAVRGRETQRLRLQDLSFPETVQDALFEAFTKPGP